MRVVVTGAAGMLGSRVARRLLIDGVLGANRVSHLVLADAFAPPRLEAEGASDPDPDPDSDSDSDSDPDSDSDSDSDSDPDSDSDSDPDPVSVRTIVADLADDGVADEIVSGGPDVIFHLAAVVSGEAESDLEKGYRVNVDASRRLFDAVNRSAAPRPPRLVFSSSIAVFGPPLPDVIGDEQPLTPATSYGTEKAIAELMIEDYTRRGVLDGVCVRLPTICVRPGTANLAASGFFSSIIREPLNGETAILPVSDDVRHWFASPRAAVGCLIHAATLPGEVLGRRRSLTMPGISATVAMLIDALRRAAGEDAASLIRREPDETIARIVAGWPERFDPRRALELGFRAETSVDGLITAYLEDELGAAGR